MHNLLWRSQARVSGMWLRKKFVTCELTTVLGSGQESAEWVSPCPKTGVVDEPPQSTSSRPGLRLAGDHSPACSRVPDIRALNLVGRFFLPLVPIETFLQAPIWDRAQREHEARLAAGLVEQKGRVSSRNHTKGRLLLWHMETLPSQPGVSKRKCWGRWTSLFSTTGMGKKVPGHSQAPPSESQEDEDT